MLSRSPSPLALVVAAATLVGAGSAAATVPLHTGMGGPRDYGESCLSPNDDGSSAAIDITSAFPQGLHFFSGTHTQVFVNTNGNITFSGAEPVYTPQAFPVASRPMIAAYWADVDLRPMVHDDCRGLSQATGEVGSGPCENPDHNGTWWKLEPGKMTITWDTVGYYSCKLDHVMDFQMVLTAVESGQACGSTPGDFDVEFRFNRCEWTTGGASGGSGGFGGTPAQVGFDAGDQTHFVQIDGSMTGEIHNIACNNSNVGEPGRWVFQIRGGSVVCPDSGAPCDTGLQGVCANGRTSCVGAGTECHADVTGSDERCNALDDDCDGSTDEDPNLCDDGYLCDRGVCVPPCTEAGCFGDQACADVTCDAGLRCVAGECVDACANVSCPVGTDCRAGRCVDACEGFACDECSVCVGGVCEARCSGDSCGAGRTCQADGSCLEDVCVGVSCDPGFFCEQGACHDACEGATCPDGQACALGACVDAAGEGEGEGDGGEGEGEGDGGEGEGEDGGEGEGEGNDGLGAGGCDCDAAGRSGIDVALMALGTLLFAARRRRARATAHTVSEVSL